jgi:hypothetical protein
VRRNQEGSRKYITVKKQQQQQQEKKKKTDREDRESITKVSSWGLERISTN